MSDKNQSDIGTALNYIMRPMLAGFVGQKLSKHFGADWWRRGVLDVLYDTQKRFLPDDGTYEKLTDSLDVQLCSILIDIHWNEIFYKNLQRSFFNYFKELQTIRNLWAHEPLHFDDKNTERALDTMILIAEELDDETAAKLRKLLSERYSRNEDEEIIVEKDENFSPTPQPKFLTPELLPAWRDVITPHPDVARGEYSQSHWAVNLANVVFKKEGPPEYTEPVEFFSRTFLTDGLKQLLVQVSRRVSNGKGEPVIQLKTSFGGGKTHSLLALYHLLSGRIRADQSWAVREVLKEAGVATLPKVSTAVFVGTWINPLKTTLWGEITAQLAHAAGKPELYEIIRRNEDSETPPGGEDLKEFLNAVGSCLILIDELVPYGRVLNREASNKLMAFIQQLTEAVGSSSQAALVVSIPQSEAEVGGDLGQKILAELEKIFGRVEFVWTPVSRYEGYEIVRRRLFGQCKEAEREKVCAAFFNMYAANKNDFPADTRGNDYKSKLLACYPIHPQLFEFFHAKWTNLENFQKTRGVLRLMSKVIYRLWKREDRSAMIMPCDIPLDAADVNSELTKSLLGQNWHAIVDAEIDGEESKARKLDEQNLRFGNLQASRKISRSIFMGTAPAPKAGDVRGVTEEELHLCTIQPQNVENIAVFNDALSKLRTNLYYLYSTDSRFWFDVTATLRKVADEKREKYSDAEIFDEIKQRLKTWQGRGEFKAVHVCPKTSADVPDEPTARLVILSPKDSFDAENVVHDILDNRGTSPRQWQNMLLFLAADAEKLSNLKDIVREFKAWSDINTESEILNLTAVQIKEVKKNLESATKTFAIKLSQAYCRLIYPASDETANINLPLHDDKIDECTNEENISAAAAKCKYDELILPVLGSEGLKRLLDEREFIWDKKDFVNVKRLWEIFAKFYYMPRLVDVNVLFDAIRRAVKNEVFALADDENFSDLQFGEINASVSGEKFLVKASKAQELIDAEKKFVEPEFKPEPEPELEPPEDTTPKKEPLPTKFIMDMQLDNNRYIKQFSKCVSETTDYLMNLPNAQMEIRFSVTVSVPEGISEETKEIVEANCHDLKIRNFYFER